MTTRSLFSQPGVDPQNGAASRFKHSTTLTSLGSCLSSDEMVAKKHEEAEEQKEMLKEVAPKPMLGQEFKKIGRSAFELLILRTRFCVSKPKDKEETKACVKEMTKRKEDWIKDLNLNLVKGKVIKSTHYFDDQNDENKLKLLQALDTEPGSREDKEFKVIEPYIRSMSVFKPYAEFESSDFQSICQDMKLHKIRKGTRLTSYGDNADTIYIIVSGRIVITWPKEELKAMIDQGNTSMQKERTQLMTDKEVQKIEKQRTFITAHGGLIPDEASKREQILNKRLQEAKTKNLKFQLFDTMLGLHKDPRMVKIRKAQPLNNIIVPECELQNLDQRIDQFYIPTDNQDDGFIHPLLSISRDASQQNIDQRASFNQSSFSKSQKLHGRPGSGKSSHSHHSPKSRKGSHHGSNQISERGSLSDESSFEEDCDRQPTISDILDKDRSPAIVTRSTYDYPIIRDKINNFEPMEVVISAIVNGCIFGKLCLANSKEKRKWMYNTITLKDTFLVSLSKQDLHKMIEKQKKRILDISMKFMKDIPSPEFNMLPKRKLQSICEALKVFTCIKGTVIFNQDDEQKYIYFVKEGQFASQIRINIAKNMKGLDPSEMLKETEATSGKLASKSKTLSTKNSGKKYRQYQIAGLGRGSVIGLEDVVIAKSDTHVTSLVCLSMVGELYQIEKEYFLQKLQSGNQSFHKKMEAQCTDNVRSQVKKLAFVKSNEEKAEFQASVQSAAAHSSKMAPQMPSQTQSVTQNYQAPSRLSEGGGGLRQIENVAQVSMMRPLQALGGKSPSSANNNEKTRYNTGRTGESKGINVDYQQENPRGNDKNLMMSNTGAPVRRPVTQGQNRTTSMGAGTRNQNNKLNITMSSHMHQARNSTTGGRTNMNSTQAFTNRFRANLMENRRKVHEALSLDLTHQNTSMNKQFNKSVSMAKNDKLFRPRVLSLTSGSFKMGDITAANTKFILRAAPRINQNQAALFSDQRQQITSPMFRKRNNPAIFNEQAVKAGAAYIPDGAPQNSTGYMSSKGGRPRGRVQTAPNDYQQ